MAGPVGPPSGAGVLPAHAGCRSLPQADVQGTIKRPRRGKFDVLPGLVQRRRSEL